MVKINKRAVPLFCYCIIIEAKTSWLCRRWSGQQDLCTLMTVNIKCKNRSTRHHIRRLAIERIFGWHDSNTQKEKEMQAIKVNIIHNCYDNTSRLIIRFLLKSSLFGTLKQHRTDLNYKNYKIYNLKSS